MRRFIFIGILLLAQFAFGGADAPKPARIEWQDWSPAIFEKAKAGKETRHPRSPRGLVPLVPRHGRADLQPNPKVIASHPRKLYRGGSQWDSRPDLASRYEDYGWLTTIIFDADGNELVGAAGSSRRSKWHSILQAFIDDPTPGPSVELMNKRRNTPPQSSLPEDAPARSCRRPLLKGYDQKFGSWAPRRAEISRLEQCRNVT